jgi:hypothetical protein
MKTKIFVLLLVTFVLSAGFGGRIHAADEVGMTIYVVPAISDEKILPTSTIPDSYISNEISVAACPGEYEPASFVIHAPDDIASLEIEATDLGGESDFISSDNIDIRVVKYWYQAGNPLEAWRGWEKLLTPELLLKDDSLVKVEGGENYLKVSGEYILVSGPDGIPGIPDRPTCGEFPVQDTATLQPVNIPAGTNKQFWVTVKIPEEAMAGIYQGTISLTSPSGLIGEISLQLEVLPIELLQPYLEYSLYYNSMLPYPSESQTGTISDDRKSETQYRAELKNLLEHGVINPNMRGKYGEYYLTALAVELEIRQQLGMANQPLYYHKELPNPTASSPEELEALETYVRENVELARSYGMTEVYFYGIDEALSKNVDTLTSQRAAWEAVRRAGGKIFVSGVREGHYPGDRSPGNFGFVGDIQDPLICHGEPSAQEAARWHSVGHKIFCYSNPQAGVEKPETYRRNFGLLLWQADYDGAMNFAYQYGYGSIWNDFDDSKFRDHVFAYPTMNGVIDTIQWEGWREGVDDVRYLTTLLALIEEAQESIDTSAAEDWLADLKSSDLTQPNLDVVRSQMIGHILSLQNEPQNQPPVLNSIGNKTVFEVSDCSLTDSEDITITVSQGWWEWWWWRTWFGWL